MSRPSLCSMLREAGAVGSNFPGGSSHQWIADVERYLSPIAATFAGPSPEIPRRLSNSLSHPLTPCNLLTDHALVVTWQLRRQESASQVRAWIGRLARFGYRPRGGRRCANMLCGEEQPGALPAARLPIPHLSSTFEAGLLRRAIPWLEAVLLFRVT